jgi:leucine dehydrogenase
MGEIFQQMADGSYEELIFAYDRPSGLKAIIAIHDTTLGPALGGCRMFPYESEADAIRDVLRLSKGMTYKAAAAGLNLGGGKSVIIGDPKKHKSEALLRAFGRAIEGLNGRYITAEDVGTGVSDMEHIRVETQYVTGLTKVKGGSGDPSPVTAYGTYKGLKACANAVFETPSLRNRKVAVQGAGHVGYHLIKSLTEEGARVTVCDIDEEALAKVRDDFGATVVGVDEIYDVDMDIFAPCAMGAIINDDTLGRLKCKVIAGAANNQLEDEEKHGNALHNMGICYAPDFVINAGGLMNVYEELEGYNRERALQKVSQLYDAIGEIIELSKEQDIPTYKAANTVAEKRIALIRDVRRTFIPRAAKPGARG